MSLRQAVPVRFSDITHAAGLDFAQSNGNCGKRYFAEHSPAGCALFDADGDGNVDIYFPQPQPLGDCQSDAPLQAHLFANDGHGHFKAVPNAGGLTTPDSAIGCSVGDYNNDGKLDVFVTCLGRSHLFRNDGHFHFTDVTDKAGVGKTGYATSAAWLDYDHDGYLDLFVCNYVRWTPQDDAHCPAGVGNALDYCTPTTYPPGANVLYHNNGHGTFTDVTAQAGVASHERALGVATLDFNGDGWLDIFVTDDVGPNRLYRNNKNGTFTDVATLTGVAYGESGVPLANMGIAVGDLDGDGKPDLAVTTFGNEPYSVFHNEGQYFTDQSTTSGIGPATLLYLGFGTAAFDADNDGDLDLFFANGHVSPFIKHHYSNQTYKQPNQLFLNDGHGHFTEAKGALPTDDVRVHRGLAVGDIDNDGRLDVLVTSNNDRPTLLRNITPATKQGSTPHWLQLILTDRRGCASPIGARVTVTAGQQRQTHIMYGGGSYASQSDYRMHFGLGTAQRAAQIVIQWPSGTKQVLTNIRANQRLSVREPALRNTG